MMAMDKIVDFVSVHFVSMTRLTPVSHILFFFCIRIPFGWISGGVGVCHVGHPTETPKEP